MALCNSCATTHAINQPSKPLNCLEDCISSQCKNHHGFFQLYLWFRISCEMPADINHPNSVVWFQRIKFCLIEMSVATEPINSNIFLDNQIV